MADTDQSRNEPATPFKLEEARKQGQVARSLDFNAGMAVATLLLALLFWGESRFAQISEICAALFQSAATLNLENESVWWHELLLTFLRLLLPFLGAALVVSLLSNLLQVGPLFSFVPLKPKPERISPIAGFKRVFSKRMLVEAAKTFVKVVLFGAVTCGFFTALWPASTSAGRIDVAAQLSWLAGQGEALLLRLVLVMLAIGVADLAYVRWQYAKQMMMSRRELKEESRRREGDPHIRARLRDLQRETLKQAQSLSRVPEADTLITNPQHLAIALKYVRGEMGAPIVIAKGSEQWAANMRAIATRHGVQIIEQKKLARLLFRQARIDHPIPPESFLDVARVYAQLDLTRRTARLETTT